jgi:hypothetical protein
MPLGLQINSPDPIGLLKLRIYFTQKVFQNIIRCSDHNTSVKYLIWKPIFPTSIIMFRPTVKDALQNRCKDTTHVGSSDVTESIFQNLRLKGRSPGGHSPFTPLPYTGIVR